MRVWDTLRALEAVRQLPEVDGKEVSLAARGEMCAVALYAALLDGKVRTIFLDTPPATQNTGGDNEGRGPTLEMLRCLRVTDLAPVAAVLWPTEVVLVNGPETYDWAEQTYRRLGAPGRFSRPKEMGSWRAA
jgi:hypothetical protein